MRQFLEILLDGASILDQVKGLRLDRRSDQAIDALTLELAGYALYSEFDFGTLPASPRVHVATADAILADGPRQIVVPVHQRRLTKDSARVLQRRVGLGIRHERWGRLRGRRSG